MPSEKSLKVIEQFNSPLRWNRPDDRKCWLWGSSRGFVGIILLGALNRLLEASEGQGWRNRLLLVRIREELASFYQDDGQIAVLRYSVAGAGCGQRGSSQVTTFLSPIPFVADTARSCRRSHRLAKASQYSNSASDIHGRAFLAANTLLRLASKIWLPSRFRYKLRALPFATHPKSVLD